MQHAGLVNAIERARDLERDAQRFARRHAPPHAPAQVARAKIFHDEIGVLVAHAEVVEPHDAGMADALHDLVLLQEAAEGLNRARSPSAGRARPSARPARRPARSRRDTGRRPGRREPANAPVAADERVAEATALPALRATCASPRAPAPACSPRAPSASSSLPCSIFARPIAAWAPSCSAEPRFGVIGLLAEENHGREAGAAGEIPHPVDAAAARPLVREQHGIEALREEFRRGNADAARGWTRSSSASGQRQREMVPDERAVARIVFDHQQPHGLRACSRDPRSELPLLRSRRLARDYSTREVSASRKRVRKLHRGFTRSFRPMTRSPTFVPGGPGVDEIAGRRERRAGIGRAAGSFCTSSSASATREQVSPSTSAPASDGRRRRCHRCRQRAAAGCRGPR